MSDVSPIQVQSPQGASPLWTYQRVWDALAAMRARPVGKAVLFGTSTTAQHAGYSAVISALLAQHWGAVSEVRGFGGMGLSLAGLVRLASVIEAGPQLVVLDFTTGPIPHDFNVMVDRLTTQLVKAGILPVWVAYPMFGPDRSYDEARSIRIQAVRRYCEAVGAPFIDAFHAYQSCEPRLFRDRVHPTEEGAKEIGRLVWAELASLATRGSERAHDPARLAEAGLPRRVLDVQSDLAFTPVEALGLDAGLDRDDEGFLIIPSGAVLEITVAGVVHCAEMRIGPYSPILEIRGEDGSAGELELWDEWCHFERPVLVPLAHRLASCNPGVVQTFRISFSARRPDYARARGQMDFTGIEPLVKLNGFHHQAGALHARVVRSGD